MTRRLAIFSVLGVVLLGLFAMPVQACTIPVFRYALERWRASPYPVTVFYDAKFTAEEQKAVEALQQVSEDSKVPGNFEVTLIDVTQPFESDYLKRLWESQPEGTKLPLMLAEYPNAYEQWHPAYAAPLSLRAVQAFLHSPVRAELAKRLLAGDSAVYLFMPSGDATLDGPAMARLKTELARLEKELKLPEQDPEDPASQLRSNLVLRLAFSILTIQRDDPAEAAVVSMLLHIEPELAAKKEPIAFPVYGRGRVLGAIVGKDIDQEWLTDANVFMTGACSCEVKDLNPGTDLMVAADWEALLEDRLVQDPEIPQLVSLAGALSPDLMPATVPTSAAPIAINPSGGDDATTQAAANPTTQPATTMAARSVFAPGSTLVFGPMLLSVLAVVLIAGVGVLVVTVLVLRRRPD